jgi:hypothetical protein
MFDTFSDGNFEAQMKCFYIPFSSGGTIMHSGGSGNLFKIGDRLPMQSTHYHYENNCIFYSDENEYPYIWVEDGVFAGLIDRIETIPPHITHFYTRHGERVRAQNIDELKHFEEAMKNREIKFESEEYWSHFVLPTYEERLKEHTAVLLTWYEIRVSEPGSRFSDMHSREIELLKVGLKTYEMEDPEKFAAFMKENNYRLKLLFI